MKILITGAFGNIGEFLIDELLRRKYNIRCFELPPKKSLAKKFKKTEVFYGDVRKIKDLKKAVNGCDAIIHLAFTSPSDCDNNINFTHKINIDGTKNIVKAIKDNPEIRLVFHSSISAYFYEIHAKTKKKDFLRYKSYAKQKLECEKIIKSSLSNWSILRIGAILPTKISDFENVFSIPYNVHFRFIDTRDVVLALANAVENTECTGKTLLIGGGKGLCIRYKEFINDIFSVSGKKLPKNEDFSLEPYLTRCFDTRKSQRILKYQKYSYQDFLSEIKEQIKDKT